MGRKSNCRNGLGGPWSNEVYFVDCNCFEVNVDYLGDDINGCGIKNVESAYHCQAECQALSGCTHFTYVSDAFIRDANFVGSCCLKNGKGTVVKGEYDGDATFATGLISGPATCRFVRVHEESEGVATNCPHLGGGSVNGGLEGCKTLCLETENCNAFNYKNDACYTKQCADTGDMPLMTHHGGWNVWIKK